MIEIRTLAGTIVEVAADAIVNAANVELWMGAGVAGAIKAAGGQQIEDEAMRQGPIERGGAVVTSAGRLKNCRYVIHAAAMGGDEWNPTADSIFQATLSSLKCAGDLGLASIAFPALGTGVGGFALAAAAAQMSRAVREYETLRPATSVNQVIFVLRDQRALKEFRGGLQERA